MEVVSRTVPLRFARLSPEEMRARARDLSSDLQRRRSVRAFSTEPVPLGVIERCIEAAASAPSGANKQPWTFVVVTDPALKHEIRLAAEEEERAFYGGRAPERWLEDLRPIGTDERKPFLESAPALIVVFAQRHGGEPESRNYYVQESVGIACGFLLASLHRAGLATLTHTPSPMGFLREILGRPEHERAFLLVPVGLPEAGCTVPDLSRKPLEEVLDWRGPR